MTQLAFVIDQGRCIGCHACTVACKVEHGIELGVFRTWVKYVETGQFPDARRHFAVLRCNHCTNPPCVSVCPVSALFKRVDGIVDFDPERCVGCKACMQACPYDALYVDPSSSTVAKCNFCAHRVELDLKPSCEIACPAAAIISGDRDDPESELSRLLDTVPSAVRAAEQGTGPNVYYVEANLAALDPLAAGGGLAYLTTQVPPSQREKLVALSDDSIAIVTGDVAHPPPWGWKVSSYFVSKGVAAGAMMLAALLSVISSGSRLTSAALGALALAAIAVTGALLVWDLARPRRFYYLLTKPQGGSWLTRGVLVITAAAVLAVAFTVAASFGWRDGRDGLRWALLPAGVLLAGYTALLFNQCEGRDLWQSPLLPAHTIVAALLAGAAGLAILASVIPAPAAVSRALAWTLVLGAAISAVAIARDTFGRFPTRQAERAARNLYRGRFARRLWLGGALLGLVVPAALAGAYVALRGNGLLAAAGVCALIGLWFYEDAWVRAGQSVPLS